MTVGSPILPLVVAMEEKHLMRSSALTGYILVALLRAVAGLDPSDMRGRMRHCILVRAVR